MSNYLPPYFRVYCVWAIHKMQHASKISYLPTEISAKDRTKQYTGILNESGGKLFSTACDFMIEHKQKHVFINMWSLNHLTVTLVLQDFSDSNLIWKPTSLNRPTPFDSPCSLSKFLLIKDCRFVLSVLVFLLLFSFLRCCWVLWIVPLNKMYFYCYYSVTKRVSFYQHWVIDLSLN